MAETPKKQYDPQSYEPAIYKKWEESGAFKPDESASGEPFVIMLPPPNITGSLHMGHALQDTIMDIFIRWHRMLGDRTLWVPGTDHAALPTNKIIVEQLSREGKTKEDIGREAFLERTQKWYSKTGAEILHQMKRLGCSCDWSRSRFTQDEEYIEAVNTAFIKYYESGYIYRGSRIVNWDPKARTTVSDLEIDWKAEKTPFYTFKYGPFEISTARPETKFGDKYVVMHPEDERYKQYSEGDTFTAEWINGTIEATVIKDDAIDMEFGTGVMTITPWHDATDFAIAERHNLTMEQIIGFDGKLLPIAGEFAGQDAVSARDSIVKKLQEKGLLVSIDENYEHNIALNDRGKGMIEPQIMRQWFLRMDKLKEDTILVAKEDIVNFVPPRWKKHFINWMENVYDWNINRQIWLGHRLPVWWKRGSHGSDQEEGNYVVSLESPGDDYEQDPDVLDTWFSSALWPFATLGWPGNTSDLKNYYPTSLLVTARDIMYLWVARMIFSGLELLKEEKYNRPELSDRAPFRGVFIHPTVLAKSGQRMSKSLGTGVDPLELIEKYGADATRFGLMHQTTYDSQAIKFDEDAIKSARNFANKIWNLARLISSLPDRRSKETLADTWIKLRLNECTAKVSGYLEKLMPGEAARTLYDFIWKDFADWYVEIVKTEGSPEVAQSVFKDVLKLAHPFMPHITETLWGTAGEKEMLITASWPATKEKNHKEQEKLRDTEKSMNAFKEVVNTVRSARRLLNIPASAEVNLYAAEPAMPESMQNLTKARLRPGLEEDMIKFPLPSGGSVGLSSPHITKDSIAGARQRLEKEALRLNDMIKKQNQIIAGMRGKAPEEVVKEKEGNLKELENQLAETNNNINSLA